MDEKPASNVGRRILIIQILATFAANLSGISPGMSLGYSAVALPQLQAANSTIKVNDEEASWIASFASIATPFGCLFIGSLMDRFGRKISLLAINVPCVLGWCLITTAQNLPMIYVGRILTGFGTGMSSTPGPIYVGEISQPHLRGMLVCWNSIALALGILIVYIMGSYLHWKTVAGLSTIFPTVAFLITLAVPESPRWLLSRGRLKQASKSMKKLRTNDLDTTSEWEEMIELNNKTSQNVSLKEKLSVFSRPEGYKPLIIMNVFFFFQQFSGIFVIIFYAVDVSQEAGSIINEYLVTVLIGVSRLLITIIVSLALRKIGRRWPAIISGIGMLLSMFVLATYLYLLSIKTFRKRNSSVNWIPVASILLYIISSTIGFLTLPWAMLGEVFPSEIRGPASGITTCMAYIFSFIIVKVYPNMKETMHNYGVFYFYGAMSVLGTLFVIFFLPETKGKTLLEIEEYFAGKKLEPSTVDELNTMCKQPTTRQDNKDNKTPLVKHLSEEIERRTIGTSV